MTYQFSEDVIRLNPELSKKECILISSGIGGEKGIKCQEKDFAAAFDDLATLRGWTWCGFRPARVRVGGADTYRTPVIGLKGCPDRILARGGRVLLVEFKTDTGRLSPEQKEWAAALVGFGGYHVVRPRDWDFVEKLLA